MRQLDGITDSTGSESEQAPGDSEGQGSPACCRPQRGKERDTTRWLSNNKAATSAVMGAAGAPRGRHLCLRGGDLTPQGVLTSTSDLNLLACASDCRPCSGLWKDHLLFPLKASSSPTSAPAQGPLPTRSSPPQALIWVPAPTPTGLFPTLLQRQPASSQPPFLFTSPCSFFLKLLSLRFVKTNYECVYSNFYKCVYSNFYKCVYSDFINVFNLILSVIISRPLTLWTWGLHSNSVTISQPGPLEREATVAGSRASTKEAPVSVLLSSRRIQRTLQGIRIRVRPARDLSQLWNFRGCPKNHHNLDRHCPKAMFLMINKVSKF